MIDDLLVVVDEQDKVLEYDTKSNCHKNNAKLHRAFSVFIFNEKGELLVQKRSEKKLLWPLYWSNSCCSHPRKDELYVEAAERRLTEELGFTTKLEYIYKFIYEASFKDIGKENELCAVLVGETDKEIHEIKCDPCEVADFKYVNIKELAKDMEEYPDIYTPWFRMEFAKLLEMNIIKLDDIQQESMNCADPITQKDIQEDEARDFFDNTLDYYKKIINKQIESFLREQKQKVPDLFMKLVYDDINNYVLNGGKRLRPIMLIMAYKAISEGQEEGVYLPSLSVELLHNSTLIHDDIMDEDEMRRNKETMHSTMRSFFLKNNAEKKYDGTIFNKESNRFAASSAICAGNILFVLSLSCLVNTKFGSAKIQEAIKIYSDTYQMLNHGQLLDLLFEKQETILEEEYLYMISYKTGKLFKASVEIGAVLAGANEKQKKALLDYAENIALAFQIQDDIMDISKNMNKGNTFASDIKNGKKTILIIKALEFAEPQDKEFLQKKLKELPTESEVEMIIKIIQKTKAFDYAKNLALAKIEKAKEALKSASLNKPAMLFFTALADFMIERNY